MAAINAVVPSGSRTMTSGRVRSTRLSVPEPVPLDQTPAGGRRTLLKLARRGVPPEAAFGRFDLRRADSRQHKPLVPPSLQNLRSFRGVKLRDLRLAK